MLVGILFAAKVAEFTPIFTTRLVWHVTAGGTMHQLQGFHAVLPTCSDSIRETQERLADLLADLEYSERDRFSVRLAVEEAMVNALKHGNQRDEERVIEVTCEADCESVRIEIGDEGPGFDPGSVRSSCEDGNVLHPNGRGIPLMQQFMDTVDFNSEGNRVILRKRRSNTEAVCV